MQLYHHVPHEEVFQLPLFVVFSMFLVTACLLELEERVELLVLVLVVDSEVAFLHLLGDLKVVNMMEHMNHLLSTFFLIAPAEVPPSTIVLEP